MKLLVLTINLCLVGHSWAASGDFSHYQVILDRMPFGSEPAPASVNATPAAVPDAESFIKTLKMTAITKNDITASICVGLVDTSTKKNYFLTVGDEEDGIALVEADYDHDRALLRKAADSRWISIGDGGAVEKSAPATTVSQPRPAFGARRILSTRGRVGMTSEEYERIKNTLPPPVSPIAALRGETPIQLRPEELDKRLRVYNMELIRAGGGKGVPLPIPLSPEEDAQLVQEGVLAP